MTKNYAIVVELQHSLVKTCCSLMRSWIEAGDITLDVDWGILYHSEDRELQFTFCPFCGTELKTSIEKKVNENEE